MDTDKIVSDVSTSRQDGKRASAGDAGAALSCSPVPPYRVWLRSLRPAARLRWRAQGVADVVEERVLPRLPRRAGAVWFDVLLAFERRRRARCAHPSWARYSAGGLEVCERCGVVRTAGGVLVGG